MACFDGKIGRLRLILWLQKVNLSIVFDRVRTSKEILFCGIYELYAKHIRECNAILEVSPSLEKLSFDPKYIPVGGFLSGFFGHQGALRTAFLIRAGLKKEVFIGSMVVSAVVVDISRLIIYGSTFFSRDFEILKNQGGIELVLAGTLAAFLGAFIGSRLLQKITMRAIQATVGVMNFPDHDFDIAMVSFGLHELSYSLMVDMLKEMHRALKPLAKLFIVDYEREKFGTP